MLSFMPSFARLLARLERYDTYPAADALSASLEDVLASPPPTHEDPAKNAEVQAAHHAAQQAGLVLWDSWRSSPKGHAAWNELVGWAEDRLSAWHSLKVNAVQSAFAADPTGADLEAMRRQALINLRQGLIDHPDLVADGHFIQALARGNHRFAWTQAVKELREDGLPLPADPEQLRRFCLIAANAFRYLIG